MTIRENGGSKLARDGQHVLMGPWVHGETRGMVGDMDFGRPADARGAKLTERNIDFFDKYLKGTDKKLPAVRYFVMGKNRWQEADKWPPRQVKWQRFFFHSEGRANTSKGDGILTRDKPGAEPVDVFIYNPLFPVPTTGSPREKATGFVPGPREQSHVEQRSDVLCYTTAVLDEGMEISGPLELHLHASTSAKDTDFTAKLCDVYPDGRVFNVCHHPLYAG